MIEAIAFFIYHRSTLFSKETGQDYKSNDAIFDAASWLVLITLMNVLFIVIIGESIIGYSFMDFASYSYSYRYRVFLIVVLISLFTIYILYRNNKKRFYELLEKFRCEDEAAREQRIKTNRWIYRFTWIGAIVAFVCTLIRRWSDAGSIF
jgi:hypothetical protein